MRLMIRSVGLLVLLLVLCTPLYAQEGGRVYYDFGVFAFEDGDYVDAESNFKKALSFEPENPYYNQYLGRTYLKQERYEEARTHLEVAQQTDPSISGLDYDLATLFFKLENFKEAAKRYALIAEADPLDVKADYFAGISFMKLKDYKQAVKHLERSSQRSPTIKDNGYYYAGICYLKMGKPEPAIEKFMYVRDNAESATLRENSEKWLSAATSRQKALKPYFLYAQLGYLYDSNVLLEPEDVATGESDSAITGFISGRYDLVKRENSVLGIGYSHFHRDYFRLTNFDYIASLPQAYIRHRMKPVTLSLTYAPSYYWIGGEDNWMKHQIRPELLWDVSEDIRLRLTYAYEARTYFIVEDRSGHNNKYDADLYYKLPSDYGQVYVGYGSEHVATKAYYQNYRKGQARVGGTFYLPWELKLQVYGKYSIRHYLGGNPNFGNLTREDKTIEGVCSLSRKIFTDWLRILAEYRYTNNDSNILFNNSELFDYTRHQASISAAVSF